MKFDTEGRVNHIPREQLDNYGLRMLPLYEDHILDLPLADYNVLNSEEVEGIFDDTDHGYVLGSGDSDPPPYTVTTIDSMLKTSSAP